MKPNRKMGQPFPDGLDAWLEENPPANPQGNCASLTAPTKHLLAGTVGQFTRPSTVKYIAQLKGVREVALLGAADLSWWRDHLVDEELEPIERDGRAQVLVSGLTSKWMGIPFRELSVAVAARYRSDSAEEGFFLARGFNTSRFFAGFADFLAALYLDNQGIPSGPEYQFTSLNIRTDFSPLLVQPRTVGNVINDNLKGTSGDFFFLSGAQQPALDIQMSAADNHKLRIVIVRTQ